MVQIHMVDGVEMVTHEDHLKAVGKLDTVIRELLENVRVFTISSTSVVEKYEQGFDDRVDRDAKINYPKSLPFEVLIKRSDRGDLVIDHSPKWLIKAEVDNMVGKSSDGSCFLVMTPRGMKKARAGDKIKFDPERGGLDVLHDWKDAPSVRD